MNLPITEPCLGLRVQTVSTVECFQELRESWQQLQGETVQTTVFSSWEWLFSWWEVFGSPDRRPCILCVYSGEQLVGLAPFHLHDSRLMGTTLRWIGTGEAVQDEVVSEYIDILARQGFEAQVVRCIGEHLENSKDWSSVVLNDAVTGHLCLRLLDSLSIRFSTETRLTGYRYSVPLDGTPEDGLMRLTSSRRKRLKRCRKAIVKDAGGLERVSITDAADVTCHLNTIRVLHSERWAGRAGGDVFDSNKFYAFHQKVLERLWSQGKAGIEIYTLFGNPVCALHLYYSSGACHYYQSGFSSAGGNRYMPLLVSHVAEMERCRQMGLSVYDFMRGPEVSYKTEFGSESTPMFDAIVYRRSSAKRLRQAHRIVRRASGKAMRATQVCLAWVATAWEG